jgi:hypothetical protein
VCVCVCVCVCYYIKPYKTEGTIPMVMLHHSTIKFYKYMYNLPLTSAALQHKKRHIVDQDPYYHSLAADVCTLSEPAITKVSDYANIYKTI